MAPKALHLLRTGGSMETVERYGQPVVSQLDYAKALEQRDFWEKRARQLETANTILARQVKRLQTRIATAQTALSPENYPP
jgi:hypothetical protein